MSLGVERVYAVSVISAFGINDFRCIVPGKKDSSLFNFNKGIDRPGGSGEGFCLGQSDILSVAEIEPIQIAFFDAIKIDYIKLAHAGSSQIHGAGRPDAAESVNRHAGSLKGFHPHIAQENRRSIPKISIHCINAPA
jgi:hypothetical protein